MKKMIISLERDFITEILSKDSDNSSGTQIMNNLKESLVNLIVVKEMLLKYLQVLMTLSDKYIKKSLEK